MKVKELIEDLTHLPPDTDAYVHSPRWTLTPYISVVNTYEFNRRVVLLLGECEEDVENKMDAENSAYIDEMERLRNQYISGRCRTCGKRIVPGSPVWVPYQSQESEELYCSAECYSCAYHGHTLAFYDSGYESHFTMKKDH